MARIRAPRSRSLSAFALAAAMMAPTLAAHPSATHAQAATSQGAQRFLEARHHEVNRVLSQSPSDARDRRLDQLLEGLIDYDELARRALARHWEGRTPAEREQFSDLLHQLVARSYKKNLQSTLSFEVRYLGEEPQDDSVVVRTRARSRENRRAQPVEIDYLMHRDEGGWRVYDVTTDGVSLVDNYRGQFNRIIDREGFDGLLRRMQSRIASGDEI